MTHWCHACEVRCGDGALNYVAIVCGILFLSLYIYVYDDSMKL